MIKKILIKLFLIISLSHLTVTSLFSQEYMGSDEEYTEAVDVVKERKHSNSLSIFQNYWQ